MLRVTCCYRYETLEGQLKHLFTLVRFSCLKKCVSVGISENDTHFIGLNINSVSLRLASNRVTHGSVTDKVLKNISQVNYETQDICIP